MSGAWADAEPSVAIRGLNFWFQLTILNRNTVSVSIKWSILPVDLRIFRGYLG